MMKPIHYSAESAIGEPSFLISSEIRAQFSAGLVAGLDPDSAWGGEPAADNGPRRTLTSLRSRWLHRLCPVCGHTFRPGDEVVVSPDGQVVHDLPGLRCDSGHAEAAAGCAQAQAFFVGLAEAWPLPADVPLVRLEGDLALKHIADPRLAEQLPELFGLLAELAGKRTALEYLKTLLVYLSMAATHVEESDIEQALATGLPKLKEKVMPTIAENWLEQGRAERR